MSEVYSLSGISIEEAEKIATEFVEKKRTDAKEITVNEVTDLDKGMRVSGTYTVPDLGPAGVFDWEVKIDKTKKVYGYKIP